MSYKYITDNNLYHKQNYMYAKYEGEEFLEAYLKSREVSREVIKDEKTKESVEEKSVVLLELQKLYTDIKNGNTNVIDLINAYVKSFEVRKRLYTEYLEWKPTEGASFEEYKSYLTFSDCLLESYRKTKCLKYYSCLLKVDDMLLSVQSLLTDREREHLSEIITEEVKIFGALSEEYGVMLEG